MSKSLILNVLNSVRTEELGIPDWMLFMSSCSWN